METLLAADNVEYRCVPGFPSYRVGTDGSVWSLWNAGARRLGATWRRLRGGRMSSGYLHVTLCAGSARRYALVHRLVLESFVGPCPEGMQACHANDIPGDNRLANLRWDSPAGNGVDRASNDTIRFGGAHHGAKLSDAVVVEIVRRARAGEARAGIAASVGVAPAQIVAILAGRAWRRATIGVDLRGLRRSDKMSDETARAVAAMVVDGAPHAVVARRFGICRALVSHIATGRTWGHATGIAFVPRRAAYRKRDAAAR